LLLLACSFDVFDFLVYNYSESQKKILEIKQPIHIKRKLILINIREFYMRNICSESEVPKPDIAVVGLM
jgi:hypothetical protein